MLSKLNFFGLIHLLYLDLVVLVPLLGVCVLLAGSGRRGGKPFRQVTPPARRLTILAIFALPIGVYASFIEPFRLQIEESTVPLPAERNGSAPIRIGVLADIQTDRITEYERDVVDQLMAAKPDFIFLTGDFFQGTADEWPDQFPVFQKLLQELSAPGGVYAVEGNVDQPAQLRQLFEGSSVQLLNNRIVRASVKGREVTIGGVGFRWNLREARNTIDQLGRSPGENDIRILISHTPDAVQAADARIDLVVSGHTHGGQVVLPLIGPPLTFSELPRYICAGGLHDFGKSRVYVSRGVGCESGQAPRLRFLCPPEISLLTLHH
jgi:predicted MPP superfamily phosphohydrolase